VDGPLLVAGGPNPFRFADPGGLSQALRQSGFADVQEETRTVPWTWPGAAEEVWEQLKDVTNPFLPLLKRVPAEQWPAIDAEVHAAIRRYENVDGMKFGASVVLASGRKS